MDIYDGAMSDEKQMAHRKGLPLGHSQTRPYRNAYCIRNWGSCKYLILLASPTGFEPVVTGVFVHSAGRIPKSRIGLGLRLDRFNLALKWSYTTGGEIANLISPTVANGVVYVTSYDVMLYALDAHTGTMLWSHNIGFSVSSPAIVYGVVYVGAGDNNVYALNASTGPNLWSYLTSNSVCIRRLQS